MAHLAYLTVVGLALDVFGFLLVILNGHAIFIRTSGNPPREGEWRDGNIWLQVENGDSEGNKRQRQKAWAGVWIVVAGFLLQIVGAVFSNLYP